MNREQFEAAVLELWMSTRIPLSRAHLQYLTGLPRKKVDGWLDELVADGVLDVDVEDSGEMVWTVPGAVRAIDGAKTPAEYTRKKQLKQEARDNLRKRTASRSEGGAGSKRNDKDDLRALKRDAMMLAGRATSSLAPATNETGAHKSMLLSAGLSLLGPVGWLYAGSWKEALPAAAGALLIAYLIPSFLLMPILWLAMPVSAVVGALYAWQFNRHGERIPLFLDDDSEKS